MPPITLHMVLARRVADDLALAELETGRGPYLLGATTPDIRMLTRQDREATHFFKLNEIEHQDSVAGFFAVHGHLAESAGLNDDTRAFVAGYLTHLIFDELYITGVYRPYFAKHDELGGHLRANLMDRLLQFNLDRLYGDDSETVEHLVGALACSVQGIECGFIDHPTLERWRTVAADVAAKNMDWERMRSMVSNHLKRAGIAEDDDLASFLDSIPALVDETMAHVTDDEISAFLARSQEQSTRTIERYLRCG